MPDARPAPHPAAAAVVLDAERVAAVRRTALLDTGAEEAFDRFTRLAAQLLDVPFVLVTLVDDERQFCKSVQGIPVEPGAPMPSMSFTHSFCQHVVAAGEPLVLPDVRAHPVHGANHAVADLGVVAYAGVPLRGASGQVLGTFCAVDQTPHGWDERDVTLLNDLAAAVVAEVELRRALGESEAARRTADLLLAASADAFLAVDAEGRCTYASPRAARYLGAPAAALVGALLLDHLPPADAAKAAALIARVRAAGAPVEAEFSAVTPGVPANPGGRRLAVRAVPTAAGGASAALRDVTERYEHQAALRASEARFRAVADTATDAIVSADDRGRITYWNAAAERIFGYAAHEALGESLGIIVPPPFRAAHDAGLARVAAGGPSTLAGRVIEIEGCRRSGEVFPVDLSLTHYEIDGAPYFTSIIRDATARRRAEAELRASEARYRAVVEQSPEPVFLHRDARVLYANAAGARLMGHADAAVLVGTDVLGGFHPDSRALAVQSIAELTAGLVQREILPYRLVRRDGSEVEVESISAVVDVDGAPAIQTLFRDVTERNRLQGLLVHQAFHDPLTGLANRALFLDRLGHALARRAGARDGGPGVAAPAAGAPPAESVAVIYLDLDDFKAVNDSLGHAHGDALLREVAARLQRATRGCDTVARLGGDEFAVLLESMTGPHDVALVVERVAAALAGPVRLGAGDAAREVRAGASVGVAHARGGETAEGLLRDAGVAMSRAKVDGRGGHAVFEPAMHAALLARVELEADLRLALAAPAARGLWVAYQPIVDLATGGVYGFEALVRWDRQSTSGPSRPVSPGEFVPVAEASGLVAPLGRWVLAEACAQLARWRQRPEAKALRLSVNVSGRQLEDIDALVLEMTESVLMHRTDDTLGRLAALKALGVGLAIDDFGTGYSSLAYLQRFPVDVLKIDKAFIDGVAASRGDRAIARTVLALGRALHLRVVAEGVEREDQRRVLAALGCRAAQGYLFARPLPAAEAGVLLAAPTPAAGVR